jgi:hypothetical protein
MGGLFVDQSAAVKAKQRVACIASVRKNSA